MTNIDLDFTRSCFKASNKLRREAAAKLGAIGGRAGVGKAKRRSPEHYARISALGAAAKKRKQKQRKQS